MAYTTIDDPTIYFNTVLYTGNGGTQSITGVGFQPDLVWGKSRSLTEGNSWNDVVRGATKSILSNSTAPEETISGVTSFNSDGFSLGSNAHMNASSSSMVAWNWKAGTAFTNDASGTGIGSIDSSGSVNTDAGFSIITYSGTNGTETVAHGLSAVPKMIIFKYRNGTINWLAYHASLGATKSIYFDGTSAATTTYDYFADTEPTSSVFTIKKDGSYVETNNSGGNYVAYCFAEKQGYSKFGSYTGNGSTDGPFIYTGFKPAFVITKRTDSTGNWGINDNKRPNYNPENLYLVANTASAEASDGSWTMDFLSNGWKARYNNGNFNASGGSYIYMAFAENPFVSSTGVPACAR